jgi:hypothetical protein
MGLHTLTMFSRGSVQDRFLLHTNLYYNYNKVQLRILNDYVSKQLSVLSISLSYTQVLQASVSVACTLLNFTTIVTLWFRLTVSVYHVSTLQSYSPRLTIDTHCFAPQHFVHDKTHLTSELAAQTDNLC